LHEFSPELDKAEGIFKSECPGDDKSGILAERMARDHVRTGRCEFPGHDDAMQEYCRLRVPRLAELDLRTVKADRGEWMAEQCVCMGHEGARIGVTLIEISRHPDVL
jgi:hypothetical protein